MERMSLEYTSQSDLLNAYKSLPQTGELVLRVPFPALETSLSSLEETGFCAITVRSPLRSDEMITVSAYKGKQGPCYDTGRKATYKGVAKAVLDDDNHVLIADHELPVCEKTARVYGLPPYQPLVMCSSASPDMLKKLETDPVFFDCNTFEDDLMTLSEWLRKKRPEEDRCLLYYPGPFKFLILDDGSIARRGKRNNVPTSQKDKLVQLEGLIETGSKGAFGKAEDGHETRSTEGIDKLIFKDIYENSGSAYFIGSGFKTSISADIHTGTSSGTKSGAAEGMPVVMHFGAAEGTSSNAVTHTRTTDLSVLKDLKTGLKGRLADVIIKNRKYFILTGSDPENALGCCPSDEVAEAGMLVRAGILSSHAQPLPEDACPLTTYAFRNEMNIGEDGILFTIDQTFRKEVLHQLKRKPVSTAGNLLRWVLLAFVVTSLVITIFRISDRTSVSPDISLFEQLSPVSRDQFMIVLFHFRERCETCLNMEKYTRGFLEDYNRGQRANDSIQFKLAVINDDRNLNLVRRFNLYTSTIVLVKFENGKEKQVKVLSDAWQLFRDEDAYKAMLGKEVESFVQQLHE